MVAERKERTSSLSSAMLLDQRLFNELNETARRTFQKYRLDNITGFGEKLFGVTQGG